MDSTTRVVGCACAVESTIYSSFVIAMTMPATTKRTMPTCIQIHVGDMDGG